MDSHYSIHWSAMRTRLDITASSVKTMIGSMTFSAGIWQKGRACNLQYMHPFCRGAQIIRPRSSARRLVLVIEHRIPLTREWSLSLSPGFIHHNAHSQCRKYTQTIAFHDENGQHEHPCLSCLPQAREDARRTPMRITKMPIGSVRNAHKPLHFMTEIIDMSKTTDACDMTHIHVFYIWKSAKTIAQCTENACRSCQTPMQRDSRVLCRKRHHPAVIHGDNACVIYTSKTTSPHLPWKMAPTRCVSRWKWRYVVCFRHVFALHKPMCFTKEMRHETVCFMEIIACRRCQTPMQRDSRVLCRKGHHHAVFNGDNACTMSTSRAPSCCISWW